MRTLFWMLVACNIAPFVAHAQASDEFRRLQPAWHVGDRWTVRTWLQPVFRPAGDRSPAPEMQPYPLDMSFEVVGTQTVRDVECLRINAVFPPNEVGLQRRYALFFSKDGGKLIRVLNWTKRTDGSEVDAHYDFPTDPGVATDASDVRSMIPFSFPAFSEAAQTNKTEELQPQAVQAVSARPDGKSFTVRIGKKLDSPRGVEVEEVWEPGLPWYRSAKTIRDGGVESEAELVLEQKP